MVEQQEITCLFSPVVPQHPFWCLLLLSWKHTPKFTGQGFLSSSGERAPVQKNPRRESIVARHPGKLSPFLPAQANETRLESRTEPCISQVKADKIKVGKVLRRIYLLYIRTEVFVYQYKPSEKNNILTVLIHTVCYTHTHTHTKVNERSRIQKTDTDPNLFFPNPCTQQIKNKVWPSTHLSASV